MSGAALASLTTLAVVGHGFFWLGAINRLHGWAGPRRLIDALTFLCFAMLVGVPLVIFAWWAYHAWQGQAWLAAWPAAQQWLSHPYVGACAVCGAIGLAIKLIWIEPRRHDRRVLLHWGRELDHTVARQHPRPVAGAVMSVLGRLPLNEALWLSTDHKRLGLPRLPAELAGLRLVHLSDLHMTGRLTRPFYEALVDKTNALEPDVICLTGDLIENEACWPWLADPLGKLQARYGVYFVLGNHDHYIDADATRRRLEDVGFVSLSGKWVHRTWNGANVLLAGNELPWHPAGGSLDDLLVEFAAAAGSTGLTDDAPPLRIVLCHTPDQFRWCCRARADLALAGHTHGGQVQFPWIGSLASPSLFGTRYACGVFRREGTVLHVTRGVAGKTPLRWRCPPEIALLELAPSPWPAVQ